MPVYETPWGIHVVTPADEERNRIFIEMCDDHDKTMADIGYYCADLIEKYEDNSLTTLGLVDWISSESQAEQKRVAAMIRKVIKADKQELKEYGILAREIEEKCNRMRGVKPEQKLEAKQFYTHLYVDIPVEKIQERIRKNEQILMLSGQVKNAPAPQLLDFERAKQVPIDTLIHFKRGFAECIWHDERTPSMKYYKKNNKVHCFGCDKSGDVIDVVQQLHQCDIKQAVAFLTNA